MNRWLFSLIVLLGIHTACCQESTDHSDTTDVIVAEENDDIFLEKSTLNPKRAAILSAVFPGLGQIYNKQYWKLPLIYGGFMLFAHYIHYQDGLYNSLKSSYKALADADPHTLNKYPRIGQTTLEVNAERIRRNRDYLIILSGIFYLLQIVDAHVSAHLHEFTINEDLSAQIQPILMPNAPTVYAGVSVSLKFK